MFLEFLKGLLYHDLLRLSVTHANDVQTLLRLVQALAVGTIDGGLLWFLHIRDA